MAEIERDFPASPDDLVNRRLMSGLNRKYRVELLTEQNHLKVVVDRCLVKCLLEACVLFKIQQVENGIVNQAVFEIIAVQNLFHDFFNQLGIVRFFAVHHDEQRNPRRVRSTRNIFVHRLGALFTLENNDCRHFGFCKFRDGFALRLHIIFHPRKSRKYHRPAVSVAGKRLRRSRSVHD